MIRPREPGRPGLGIPVPRPPILLVASLLILGCGYTQPRGLRLFGFDHHPIRTLLAEDATPVLEIENTTAECMAYHGSPCGTPQVTVLVWDGFTWVEDVRIDPWGEAVQLNELQPGERILFAAPLPAGYGPVRGVERQGDILILVGLYDCLGSELRPALSQTFRDIRIRRFDPLAVPSRGPCIEAS